jgi:hypothetical protein
MFDTMRTWIAAVLILFFPSPVRAQVGTLVCTSPGDGNHLFEINFGRKTACVQSPRSTQCAGSFPVTISDRHIMIRLGGPVSIDRKSGVILWVDGSQGTCHGDALTN